MEIGESKFWNRIIRMLTIGAFLGIILLTLCRCASQQKIAGTEFIDDYSIKKSSIFKISTEVRVDSLIVPANTVGKIRELQPNEKGGINMFVFDFLSQNGQEVSLRFIRKELVEKQPINSRSFTLRGEAEFYQGKNYRAKKTLKPLSVPKGEECALLFTQ